MGLGERLTGDMSMSMTMKTVQCQERSRDEDNVTNVVDDNELSDELCKDGESGKHCHECCKTVLLAM